MKLNIFEKQIVTVGKKVSPIALFSISKSNVISFNKIACDIINLKQDDYIEFLNDEENKKDWYFHKVTQTNINGFKLREIKSGALCISNTNLAKAIRETIKCDEENIKFRLATQPDEHYNVYAILTSVNLADKK